MMAAMKVTMTMMVDDVGNDDGDDIGFDDACDSRGCIPGIGGGFSRFIVMPVMLGVFVRFDRRFHSFSIYYLRD